MLHTNVVEFVTLVTVPYVIVPVVFLIIIPGTTARFAAKIIIVWLPTITPVTGAVIAVVETTESGVSSAQVKASGLVNILKLFKI